MTHPFRPIENDLGDPHRLSGAVDYLDAQLGLRGWIVHPAALGRPIAVQAWAAGHRLAQTLALLDRPDIDAVLGQKTWCGFLLGWSRFDRTLLAQLAEEVPEAPVVLASGGLILHTTLEPLTVAAVAALVDAAPQGDLGPDLAELNACLDLDDSGLFDPLWYRRAYGEDPLHRPQILRHIQEGAARKRRSNLYTLVHFDPEHVVQAGGSGRLADHLALNPRPSPNAFVPQALLDPLDAADPYEALLRQMPDSLRDRLLQSEAGRAILADAEELFPTSRDPAELTRKLDDALVTRDIPRAQRLAEALRQHDPLPGWGRVALARLARLQSRPNEARDLLRAIPPGAEPLLLSIAATILLEIGDLDGAALHVAALGDRPGAAADEVRIRLALHRGDAPALTKALDRADARLLPTGVLCEAAYRLVRPGAEADPDFTRAEDLVLEGLARVSAENPDALRARLHMLLQRRRFAELEAALDDSAGQPAAAEVNLDFQRLELLYLTGRLPEALELWHARLAGRPLERFESIIALRLLSEVQDWAAAAEVVMAHLAAGHGFGEAVFLAMRVLRQTGLHDRVLSLQAGPDPDRAHFLELAALDRRLVASARGEELPPANIDWLTSTRAARGGEVLFVCSDRRYFLSVLTLLSSIFAQPVQSGAEVFVFLDQDVPEDWIAALSTLARPVTMVREADFVPQGIDYKVELGFFAAGSGLTRAAYFRLYAARHLMARGAFRRGVYLDTDIICRADLTGLFDLDLGGAPLAARPEEAGPEVTAAASRNGIDPARYFNSGVLVMDFTHPGLPPALSRAILLTETEPDRLVFHDQCALNIGFEDQFAELPAAWNFFLRPFRPQNGAVQDGALLHYLDRPKPWDISFWRNYREEWRLWALVLAQSLPQELFTALMATANGADLAPPPAEPVALTRPASSLA